MSLSTAQRQALTWFVLAASFVALLWWLAPVLTPFLIGAVLAYALHPAVEKMVRRRVPRVIAVILIEIVVVVATLAVLLLIVPILSKQLPLMRDQIPMFADRMNRTVVPWLSQFGLQLSLDINSIKAFILKYFDANAEDWLSTALASARIGGGVVLTVIGNAVLVPVVLFYLLIDWPRIVNHLHTMVPPRLRDSVDSFLSECDDVLGQYLRGQALLMLILATYYGVGLAIFGFDLAVPVGVFTGLAIFIPYIGFGLGLLLALMAGVLQFNGFHGVIAVAVVYGIGQVAESMVLTPRLVGERIGLNPLGAIFALLAFGHLFGFVGVLVALPVSAVIAVAAGRLRRVYLTSRLYNG